MARSTKAPASVAASASKALVAGKQSVAQPTASGAKRSRASALTEQAISIAPAATTAQPIARSRKASANEPSTVSTSFDSAMSSLHSLDANDSASDDDENAHIDASSDRDEDDERIDAFPELGSESEDESDEVQAQIKQTEADTNDSSSYPEDEDDSQDDSDDSSEADDESDASDSSSAPAMPPATDENTSRDSSPAHTVKTVKPHPLAMPAGTARARLQRESHLLQQTDSFIPVQANDECVANLSDSSDEGNATGQGLMHKNRIGSVPLDWYKDEAHIGYSVSGKRIAKRQASDEIDALLSRIDDPNFGRIIHDALNDEDIVLTPDEMNLLHRVRRGEFAHGTQFDPYQDFDGEAFTSEIRHTLIGNAIEPKRRFIPSKHEAKRVVKLVNAIKNGWLKTSSQLAEEAAKAKEKRDSAYLLWSADGSVIEDIDDAKKSLHRMPATIAPTRSALPSHAYSYNPPREYIPTEDELAVWQSQDPSDQPYAGFVPRAYSSLREVPQYDGYIKERFERCLDLYLCPRTRRTKLNIDPESLIPVLPKPSELKPFPKALSIEFHGHRGVIRSLSMSADGHWLASAGEDGLVKLWESSTGRCFKTWDFNLPSNAANAGEKVVVECVAFHPSNDTPLLAVCVGTFVVMLHTRTGTDAQAQRVQEMFKVVSDSHAPTADAVNSTSESAKAKQLKSLARTSWRLRKEKNGKLHKFVALQDSKYAHLVNSDDEADEANEAEETEDHPDALHATDESTTALVIDTGRPCTSVSFHAKGDYLSSISKVSNDASLVLIHRLSRHETQSPFSKSKGLVSRVLFHPSKSLFFLATKRHVFIYNLLTQSLLKKLTSPCKWISDMSLHASGDHLLVSSYDRKVCWYDLDLSSSPYKTLKYHTHAVRQVAFHMRYPLFLSAADDGHMHIFHAKVYTDLMTNPMIVPVKVIATPCVIANQTPPQSQADAAAHNQDASSTQTKQLGVVAAIWHPRLPQLFAAGADQIIRLFH